MSIKKIEQNTEPNKEFKDFLEKQLDRTNYWLSFAEAKNGALIAVNVAIMAVITSVFEMAPIICTLTIVCFVASSGVCLKSFFPNTDSRPKKEEQDCKNKKENPNLIFYEDIAEISSCYEYIELTIERYFPKMEFLEDDKMIDDLGCEILINSRITSKKYSNFKCAVKIDFIALLMVVLFFIAA